MAEIGSPSLDELPKVETDLKTELENFNVDALKTTKTVVLSNPSQLAFAAEKTKEAIEEFNTSKLKHVDVVEKKVLPDVENIVAEKSHKEFVEGIEGFDATTLKHAETKESNSLPTKEVIAQEKEV